MSEIRQAPPVPEWAVELDIAADRAYEANPGGPLRPETLARIKRCLFPARPMNAERAA